MNCDLCKKDSSLDNDVLCLSCREAIQRVMNIELWKIYRERDKQLNNEQAQILIAALRIWPHGHN
jgi:hypothetical protein